MKIIDNRKKENTKDFRDLKVGDTFRTTQSDEVFYENGKNL